MKRLFAFLLTLVLMLSMTVTAVAAEEPTNGEIPENATRHTIALTLAPEEVYNVNVIAAGADSATPYAWGDPSMTIIDNHQAYTTQFYLEDRYVAFETQGFLENAPDGVYDGYAVALKYVGSGSIASTSCHADGSLYKVDWITVNVDGYYHFLVTNATDYHLTVYLTYYTWN